MAAERLQDIIELYRFGEGNNTFTSICTLVYNRDVVHVKGLANPMTLPDWRELKAHLIEQGVKEITWERRGGKEARRKSLPIRDYDNVK
jgi:hypothetical protein